MKTLKLMQHQAEVFELSRGLSRVAFFYDMGLGKTFIGSEKLKELEFSTNLIVCQKSKVDDWVEHFNDYYRDWEVFDLTDPKAFLRFFEDARKKSCVGVINYDMIWRRKEFLNLEGFAMLLDESSLIQNHTAKRSKRIMKMQADAIILLSGTPTSGKYENLWTQARLLGWNISYKAYQSHYVNWVKLEEVPVKVVDKINPYKNVERLKMKFRQNGAFFKKAEEVIDLPEQTFIKVRPKASHLYLDFVHDSIVSVDAGTCLVGDSILKKRLYMRMLCGQYSREKLQAFADLIESTEDRVIVFYNFNAELELLKNLTEKPKSYVIGTVKDLTAYETESNSVTFVQYQAGSMGLNLQKSNKIIYFTLPERSELFEQSKARIHRIGQERPCFYYLMLCKNSIENSIYSALERRKDFTDELFKEHT